MTSSKIIADLKDMLRAFQGKGWSARSAMRAVINHGRPYVGVKRPKGYRKRKAKYCFHNAAMLAIEGRGTYVEGFASFLDGMPIHHAWVTLDGVHAIDVTWTWRDPADCSYFGIAFPTQILARHFYLIPLLSNSSAGLREILLADPNEPRSTTAVIDSASDAEPPAPPVDSNNLDIPGIPRR
jgi:hypothetical protein